MAHQRLLDLDVRQQGAAGGERERVGGRLQPYLVIVN